jgi:hypothetical protein
VTGGVACDRCRRRFPDPAVLALHRGRAHPGTLTDAERAAFEEARREETAWMRRFRAHLAGGLASLAPLATYAAAALPAALLGANPALLVLPFPGIAIFAAVTYGWVYRHRLEVEERGVEGG